MDPIQYERALGSPSLIPLRLDSIVGRAGNFHLEDEQHSSIRYYHLYPIFLFVFQRAKNNGRRNCEVTKEVFIGGVMRTIIRWLGLIGSSSARLNVEVALG